MVACCRRAQATFGALQVKRACKRRPSRRPHRTSFESRGSTSVDCSVPPGAVARSGYQANTHMSVMAYVRSQPAKALVCRRYGVCRTFARRPKAALESQLEPISPIRYRSAKASEHRRKPSKTLSLAGRCSRVFVAVRGEWDRKRTAEWPLRSVLRSHWKPEPIPAS
jgi:hypothetical protein